MAGRRALTIEEKITKAQEFVIQTNIVLMPLALKVIIADIAVSLCWVCFRAEDTQTIRDIFYRLCLWESFGVHQMYIYAWIASVLLIIISVYAVYNTSGQGLEPIMDITQPKYFLFFVLRFLYC